MDASVATAKNARAAAGKQPQQDKVNQSVMSRKSVQTVALSQSVTRSRVGATSRTILSSSKSGRAFAANAADKDKLQPPYRPPVRVIDPETGADVTPLPLLLVDPAAVKRNQSNILIDSSQGGTPSEFMSQASIYQTGGGGGGGTVNASMFGGGPFTRSVIGASVAPSEADGLSLSEDHPEQAVAAAAPAGAAAGAAAGDLSAFATMKSDDGKDDPLTDAVLGRRVEVVLGETDTIFLLDLVGTSVSTDSAEAQLVSLKNEHYRDVCKTRAGNDLYAERGMNTFNDPLKLKVVQTDKISTSDVAVTATSWDMYDTFESVKQLQEERDNPGPERGRELSAPSSRPMSTKGGPASAIKDESASEDSKGRRSLHQTSTVKGTQISRIVEESEVSDSMMSLPANAAAASAAVDASEDSQREARAQKERELLSSAKLRDDLFIMERVVNVNTYQPKLASYRDFSPIARGGGGGGGGDAKADSSAVAIAAATATTSTSSSAAVAVASSTAGGAGGGGGGGATAGTGPSLERLWCYASPITKGRNVSCCAWNKANPDLVAVGYGQFEFTSQKSGIVCCWSLKNPEHPERLYQCEAGVTAIDFSAKNPNLLAVGTYDGNIAIYNVRAATAASPSAAAEPVLDTTDSPGRHTAPVWQLRWVEKDKGERGGGDGQEVIVSISADGRVSQWTIRKGFECGDLMKLKRVQMKQQIGGKAKEKKGDALISRLAGGFTFAFSAVDGLMYLAGTEEGYIHKCSCSYNEQYLDTYDSHGGPVYHVQWSPYCPNVFLSCSGDWSVRLWRQDRLKPILSFYSSTKSVNGVCWSPYSSTVFACVNDSAVEVWDMAQSTLDPVIASTSSGAKQTTVTFASNSETILVGDSAGQVTVYQLKGMPAKPAEQARVLEKIIDQSVASQEQMEPPSPGDAGKKALTGA